MPKLITKLSPEQTALMPVVRDEYIEFALKGTGPVKDLRKHIDWLYGLAGMNPPVMVVEVESPMAMQIAFNILRWAYLGFQKMRVEVLKGIHRATCALLGCVQPGPG